MEHYSNEILIYRPSPAFGIWFEETPAEQTELVCEAVIRAGKAEDKTSAIHYLDNLLKDFPLNQSVASCDIFGGNNIPARPYLKLKKLLGKKKENGITQIWRDHGTKGHIAIPAMMAKSADEIFALARCSGYAAASLIQEIKSLRHILTAISKQRNLSHFWTETGILKDLARLITPIFGDTASDLLKTSGNPVGAPILLTTMQSWLTALHVHLKTGKPRIFFCEIPAISQRRHQINAGVIDAVEVLRVNGKRPSTEQCRMLRQLSQGKFTSVSELMRCLIRLFQSKRKTIFIEVGIIDFKFAVGDSDKFPSAAAPNPVITLKDVGEKPIARHRDQLLRYLAMATFGHQLECGKTPTLWDEKTNISLGRLKYILPEKIIRHEIPVSPEMLNSFLSAVARKINPAKTRANARRINNFLVNSAIKLLNGNGKNDSNGKYRPFNAKTASSSQPFLFPEHQNAFQALEEIRQQDILRQKAELQERIANMRQNEHLDLYNILRLNHRRDAKYLLNYQRLLQAIEDGRVIPGRNFSPENGGHIQCPFTDHDDTGTPSFHITPGKLSFTCYGCDRWGKIDPNSIPAQLNITASFDQTGASRFSRLKKKTEEQTPSETHYRIMETAQSLFQENFWNSAGKKYLHKERCVDPSLAYSLGIGYGTSDLIHGLLDAGYAYDQLIFYGFIGISERISPGYGVTQLLVSRGMQLAEIRRECGKTKSGNSLFGFPYFTMNKRITFPLGLKNGIDSFYGRSIICGSKMPHYKLSKKYTNIPHGVFNFQALASSADNEVKMAEAGIDTLSLIEIGRRFQLDCEKTIGIIGVLNYNIMAELLQAEIGGLAIAFDRDLSKISSEGKEIGQTGQRKTLKFIAELQKHGVLYPIRDFTGAFYAEHREISPVKDWNALWQNLCKKSN
jgi:hypothetical protein